MSTEQTSPENLAALQQARTILADQQETTLDDIRPGGRLYGLLVVGSLTDAEWETVRAEILSQGEIPEDWRALLKGAVSDE